MAKVAHHGHDVVLNISQIHSNIHSWRDFVIFVASLGETAQNICFAAEKLHQAHDVLSHFANSTQKRLHVVRTSSKDLILDFIRIPLDSSDYRGETIDNVITVNVLALLDPGRERR